MVIRGKTVYLRSLEINDAATLYEMAMQSEAYKSTTPFWRPWNQKDFESYIDRGNHTYEYFRISLAICMAEKELKDKLIGTIDLHKINWLHGTSEVGMIIWPDKYRGHGYGKDALRTVVNWAFNTVRFRRLYSKVFANNEASISCFKKVGFRKEGVWRKHYYIQGHYIDAILFGLLIEEFTVE